MSLWPFSSIIHWMLGLLKLFMGYKFGYFILLVTSAGGFTLKFCTRRFQLGDYKFA